MSEVSLCRSESKDSTRSPLFQLFGVKLRQRPVLPGKVWHEKVQKYAFVKQEETLGILYCDFFHWPDKLVLKRQFIIQGGHERQDGSFQMRVIVLSLSFTSGLLNQQAVKTSSIKWAMRLR